MPTYSASDQLWVQRLTRTEVWILTNDLLKTYLKQKTHYKMFKGATCGSDYGAHCAASLLPKLSTVDFITVWETKYTQNKVFSTQL